VVTSFPPRLVENALHGFARARPQFWARSPVA